MKRRYSTIFLVTALVLIPVLFGLMPLKIMHKLSSGAPLSPVKPVLTCDACPFHSLTSHPEATQIDLSSVPIEPPSATPLTPSVTDKDLFPIALLPDILPLRC